MWERKMNWLLPTRSQMGIKPTTFWCAGQHSKKLSYLARTLSHLYLETCGLLLTYGADSFRRHRLRSFMICLLLTFPVYYFLLHPKHPRLQSWWRVCHSLKCYCLFLVFIWIAFLPHHCLLCLANSYSKLNLNVTSPIHSANLYGVLTMLQPWFAPLTPLLSPFVHTLLREVIWTVWMGSWVSELGRLYLNPTLCDLG